MIILALACWGRLFYLRGLWGTDWMTVWSYLGTDSYRAFDFQWRSINHSLYGIILYMGCIAYFKVNTTLIFYIIYFFLFTLNGLLIYFIFRNITRYKTILPEIIGAIYMVSPLVNTLLFCVMPRTIFLSAFLMSVFLTILSVKEDKLNWLYYICSIVLSVFAISGLESFLFIEIFRPVIMYYIISKDNSFTKKIKSVIIYWSPYILIGFGIILYAVLSIPVDAYNYSYKPKVMFSLSGLKLICYNYIYSLYYLFFGISRYMWAAILRGDILTYFLSICLAVLTGWILLRTDEKDNINADILFEIKWIMIFGLLFILAAIFPYAVTRGVLQIGSGSRYALEANVGMAVFISSSIMFLYYKNIITKRLGQVIIAVLVLFGVGICNTVVQNYDDDWQQQRAFWWQFMRRVPDLKKGTLLLVDMDRDIKYVSYDYWHNDELSGALNILYAPSKGKDVLWNYFSDSIIPHITEDFIEKRGLDTAIHKCDYPFQYYPKNLLVASFHDGILSLNGDIDYPNKQININPLVVNSSPDRILIFNKKQFPFRGIIGAEPTEINGSSILRRMNTILGRHIMEKDWRYYYQDAMVLLERGDFQGVVKLYGDATRLCTDEESFWKYFPQLPEILVPFIQAFYITKDYTRGDTLLWQWAICNHGRLAKALEIKDNILKLGQYSETADRLDKDIKEIFYTKGDTPSYSARH